MSEIISQRELRNDSGRIMQGLDAGKSYVITRNREVVGELRPMRRRRAVPVALLKDHLSKSVQVDAKTLRADLDDAIDQSIERHG